MIWKLQFQICALLLLLLLDLVCWKRKNSALVKETIFFSFLIVTTLSLGLNIVSSVMILFRNQIPSFLLHGVNKLYLISRILTAYSVLCYSLTDFVYRKSAFYRRLFLCSLPVAAGIIAILFAPIYYHTGSCTVYAYGACVTLAFSVVLCCLGIGFYVTLRNRQKMRAERIHSILFLLICFSFAAAAEYLYPYDAITGFAMAFGMVWVYAGKEKPADFIDTVTGVFNKQALQKYLFDLQCQNENYAIMMVTFHRLPFFCKTFGLDDTHRIIKKIGKLFAAIPGGQVFRSARYEFTLIFLEAEEMELALEEMAARFRHPFQAVGVEVKLTANFYYAPDGRIFPSSEASLDYFRFAAESQEDQCGGKVVCIDESILKRKEEYGENLRIFYEALEGGCVEITYRPIHSLKKGRVVSLEVYIRVRELEGREFKLEELFSVAEREGRSTELEKLIWNKICDFIMQIPFEEQGIDYISICISTRQSLQSNFADNCLARLRECGIAPEHVCLKVTAEAVQFQTNLQKDMKRLHKAGIRLAIYNYGRENANPNIFLGLPVSQVFLPGPLFREFLEHREKSEWLAFATNSIHYFGMELGVDGVDSKEDFAALKDGWKVDLVKGMWAGRERTGEEYLEMWRKECL